MKQLILGFLAISLMTSCGQRFNADYESRLQGLHAVCPHCTLNSYADKFYAVDTSYQPNKVYVVDFCAGFSYSTSTVDHLTKIN